MTRSDAATLPELTDNGTAPIVVLDPDIAQARRVSGWLRSSGLGGIAIARTCDEALFLLGRRDAALLIVDEFFSTTGEQRLLRHIASCGHAPPMVVRLVETAPRLPDNGGRMLTEYAVKPLDAHNIVVRVGTALDRPDLVGRMDSGRDQADANLATARRMQLALLPTSGQLAALQAECAAVCLSGFCRSGEAVGGDFWGAWPTGDGQFALALADFAGHGLSAALNTFRLHAILSEDALPRRSPVRMMRLLNRRLHGLLQRGQYATMIYAQIDTVLREVEWCSAGGPPPLFVSATDGQLDLAGRGLPLGVKADAEYRSCVVRLPQPGILCMFSDGLYEGGERTEDISREQIAGVLAHPARLAASGRLSEATRRASTELEALRNRHPCLDHSDDVMAVCVAFGPAQ